MTAIMDRDEAWKLDLPTLEGLLESNDTVSTILRPFSRLRIPFFRSTSSATDIGQLKELRELSADGEVLDDLDGNRVRKALVDLQNLARQVKAGSDVSEGRLERLCEGYLRGFYLASHVKYGGMAEISRQCLVGLELLSPRIPQSDVLHRALVGSVFPDTHNGHERFLTPVFARPKALTETMRRHHLQRTDGKAGTPSLAAEPVRAIEVQASHQLDLLDHFIQLVKPSERLPGSADSQFKSTKGGSKAREAVERGRPLRLALEAELVKCELATGLASADNAAIKRRAIALHETGEAEAVASTHSDAAEEDVEEDPEEESGEDPEGDKEVKPTTASSEETDSRMTHPSGTTKDTEHWDVRAEDALLACLETACALLRERRFDVLTDVVYRSDWIEDEIAADKNHITGKAHKGGVAEEGSDTDSDESDSDSDSDSDDGKKASGPHSPAPLRAIFRLQDRYEELRLAVWLALPVHSRGKMPAFMRGVPTEVELAAWREGGMAESEVLSRSRGRVAEAWDHLGLLLLKHFDRSDLLDFGLDIEKLDKWQEYVSSKEDRKAKRGRKTV